MKKRVFIIHGWDGHPKEGWFPWLKKELEKKGFAVSVPQMPDAGSPRISNWVPKVKEIVGTPDKDTYLVGHSMGCQTIARYLESLPESKKIGGAVFVAGFFKRLTNIGADPEEQEIVKHWLQTPLNLEKVKDRVNKSIAIFSNDDPFVPLDNQNDFRDKLGTKIIIEHNKGHINEEIGIKELPSALNALLELAE